MSNADRSITHFNFVGAITRPARNLIVGTTRFLPQPFNGIAQIAIGTSVTAVLAGTAVTGLQAQPALAIGLVHFFFNVLSVLVIYGIPFLRPLPLIGAQRLAVASSENKIVAFVYMIGVFFVIPFLLLGLSLIF